MVTYSIILRSVGRSPGYIHGFKSMKEALEFLENSIRNTTDNDHLTIEIRLTSELTEINHND